jgi:hypothetical protein
MTDKFVIRSMDPILQLKRAGSWSVPDPDAGADRHPCARERAKLHEICAILAAVRGFPRETCGLHQRSRHTPMGMGCNVDLVDG